MNVITRLRLTVITLFGFATLNLIVIYSQINNMTDNGKIINYTGIVRGKSQRMIKLKIAKKDTNEIKNDLDSIIQGLIEGDKKQGLPQIKDKVFQENMSQVEQQWNVVNKINLDNSNNSENIEQLIKESETLWDLTNKATFSAQEFADKNVQHSKTIAILIFIINLILLTVVLMITENITLKLKETVRVIAVSSEEITATFEQQERAITEQTSSVHETSATMGELEASSQQSAQQASLAAENAHKARLISDEGNKTVVKTLQGMSDLHDEVHNIADAISKLSDQTIQISNISELVSNIANQTNMLALNASVEAVRAGEHGKGFAVVATEIRKLADQSRLSADKIQNLVNDIHTAITETVINTEAGTKTVKDGVAIAQKTAQAFAGIVEAIEEIALSSQRISLNAHQQSLAISEVVGNINHLSQTGNQTTHSLSQIKKGTDQLHQMINSLHDMVSS